MRITREIAIAAPHMRVWELIDNDDRRRLWMPDLIATTYPRGRPTGDPAGTQIRVTLREDASIRTLSGRIEACVVGRLRAVSLADDRFEMHVSYQLGHNGGSTRVRYSGQFRLSGVGPASGGSVMFALARPIVERRVTDGLVRLKTVAETVADRSFAKAPPRCGS
jgi:carbon monoxide dehydrogenase subunit G